MAYEVEFTHEFEVWWNSLTPDEQDSVDYSVSLLQQFGIHLKRPHADTLKGGKHSNLRELRVQHRGSPIRILFAFDPRRVAILLLGGNKTGRKDWYAETVPKAEAIYVRHLKSIEND